MNSRTGPERRQFERIPRKFLVVCKDPSGAIATIPHFVYAYGRNISKGGIFFESVEEFKNDSLLEFSLYSSNMPEAIKVKGKIVWSRLAQDGDINYYGVNFCELNPHDMLLIEKLIGTDINEDETISSIGDKNIFGS